MLSLLPVSLETVSVFVAASVALALTPGPDNIFVLTQSALHGRFAGLCVTIGLCSGLMVHTAAVALGAAVIFATSALAFNLLKIIGAAYLLFLAWRALREGKTSIESGKTHELKSSRLYTRGVIMSVANPKVGIFFMAFLPQFAVPGRDDLALQLLLLGAIFIMTTLVVFGSIASFSGILGEKLRASHCADIYLNRIAGFVFAALAMKLVFAER